MQVDLSSDFFELFGLAVEFAVDEGQLQSRYRELQKNLHPDRFAAGSDAEKRWSLQAAAHVNEAHNTLRKPLARATYLLKLRGVDLDVETDTRMPPEFLMEQMELREQLEEIPGKADPFESADKVRVSLRDSVTKVSEQFVASLANDDEDAARGYARQWQFLDKLMNELGDIEASLDDG